MISASLNKFEPNSFLLYFRRQLIHPLSAIIVIIIKSDYDDSRIFWRIFAKPRKLAGAILSNYFDIDF